MNELEKCNYIDQEFYKSVKEVLDKARKRVYRNIQNEMVLAYWQIGKMIVEKQGGKERAKYGDGLIKELSVRMTEDFGHGFDERELRRMRQFYLFFPIWDTVCPELCWSHFRLLNKVNRDYYAKEVVEGDWSVRQLKALQDFRSDD